MSRTWKTTRRLMLGLLLCLLISFASCNKKCKKEVDPPKPVIPVDTITQTKLTVYDGPSIMETSKLAKIKVNDKDLFVYETNVNSGRVFTFSDTLIHKVPLVIFDFEGKVDVEVTIPGITITSAKVTPLASEVVTTIENNVIKFSLEYPTTYTVEYNNQSDDVVHIISNPIEENIPDVDNLPENMIYLGPGVYKSDAIPLESNSELYIAGGAVVFGSIRSGYSENIKIRGRGIISGELYSRLTASEFTIPFELQHCKNVTLEGITFLDPAGWTINNYFIEDMIIDNIHIFTSRANGDGISLQSCKNIVVKNSFVRTWDDAIVVKNYDLGTTDNILCENNLIWNDLAQSMEVGYECYGTTINNVTFNNITVLHNFHKAVISIHNADQALITNVKYTNITIEDAQMGGDNATSETDDFLIDLNILFNNEWTSSGGERGNIKGVTIDNVKVLAGKTDLITRVNGYDATHTIEDVLISNINFLSKEIKSLNDLNYKTNEFAKDVKVSYDYSTGATISKPYNVQITEEPIITQIPNIIQQGLIVPSFAIGTITESYMGIVATGEFIADAYRGTGTNDWNDGNGSYEEINHESNKLIDDDLTTYWQAKPWVSKVTTEYATVNITFDHPQTIGTIRLYGDKDSPFYQTQYIAIYGIKSTGTKYSKVLGGNNYEFSPASGNYVDVKITPNTFTALQIRIYYREGLSYPSQAYLNEIKFYPASLSFGKTVIGTEHEDVYKITNIVDGLLDTYYEGKKGALPANITINFDAIYNIKYIILNLPPLMQWSARTQKITFMTSIDGENWTELFVDKDCLFDPKTGNMVEIVLDEKVTCQYLKLIIKTNTASGGYSAQLSEISVYE